MNDSFVHVEAGVTSGSEEDVDIVQPTDLHTPPSEDEMGAKAAALLASPPSKNILGKATLMSNIVKENPEHASACANAASDASGEGVESQSPIAAAAPPGSSLAPGVYNTPSTARPSTPKSVTFPDTNSAGIASPALPRAPPSTPAYLLPIASPRGTAKAASPGTPRFLLPSSAAAISPRGAQPVRATDTPRRHLCVTTPHEAKVDLTKTEQKIPEPHTNTPSAGLVDQKGPGLVTPVLPRAPPSSPNNFLPPFSVDAKNISTPTTTSSEFKSPSNAIPSENAIPSSESAVPSSPMGPSSTTLPIRILHSARPPRPPAPPPIPEIRARFISGNCDCCPFECPLPPECPLWCPSACRGAALPPPETPAMVAIQSKTPDLIVRAPSRPITTSFSAPSKPVARLGTNFTWVCCYERPCDALSFCHSAADWPLLRLQAHEQASCCRVACLTPLRFACCGFPAFMVGGCSDIARILCLDCSICGPKVERECFIFRATHGCNNSVCDAPYLRRRLAHDGSPSACCWIATAPPERMYETRTPFDAYLLRSVDQCCHALCCVGMSSAPANVPVDRFVRNHLPPTSVTAER